MFERIDREADGEVYVNEVLDFLRSISSDLDQVGVGRGATTSSCTLKYKINLFIHDHRMRRLRSCLVSTDRRVTGFCIFKSLW